jgi:hypothetical protein
VKWRATLLSKNNSECSCNFENDSAARTCCAEMFDTGD